MDGRLDLMLVCDGVARIQPKGDSASSQLPSRCLIGRSHACQLRVATPETSSEHALLRWRSGAWELQDLHSRNGTYVDGRRLASGQSIGLAPGTTLGFGRPDEYVLIDAGPPEPHAVGIEPFLADQIEVLKGPGTLLFGSGGRQCAVGRLVGHEMLQ